jgi:fucose 4-O-acetylase-like acetyltransferase
MKLNMFNSDYILSNKRFGWIDYDRGISIILVTYRHCYEQMYRTFGENMHSYPWLEYINVFFFGFRMPLFFIASGIFISGSMRKRGLGTYAKNRVQTILYPMLVWGIIQLSLQIIFKEHTNSAVVEQASAAENTPSNPFLNYLNLIIDPRVTGQFWYLNALFFVGIIYASLKSFLKFKVPHQVVFGLILYLVNAYVNREGIHIYFASDICKYYLFFAIGDAISSFMLEERTAKFFTSWKLVLPLFIAFITIQYFFTEINLSPHNSSDTRATATLYLLPDSSIVETKEIRDAAVFIVNKNNEYFLNIEAADSTSLYTPVSINDSSAGITIAFSTKADKLNGISVLSRQNFLKPATDATTTGTTSLKISREAVASNYYVENQMPLFFLLVALVGCAMSIALSFSLKKYNKARFLRVVGYNSVHIYCMQIISMGFAKTVFIKLGLTNIPLLTLCTLIAGLTIPMVVYNICLRLNMWWLFTLKKPEEEIEYLAQRKSSKEKET